MKSYLLITKNNVDDFNRVVNDVIREHRKDNPRLIYFNSCISPGSSVYYSGVVEWGKDDPRPAVSRQL